MEMRFAFGENWTRFLAVLDEDRVHQAERSLRDMLRVRALTGKRFLDVGSGSGLFSLAARGLGATVHSFDYDPQSVACTEELRRRFFPQDRDWTVEAGSALDAQYLKRLGQFDVVYAWGVLHHTGRMYEAFECVSGTVAPGGQLFIAIYNDQGAMSRYWKLVKRAYNRSTVGRGLVVAVHAPYLFGARWLVRAATGRLRHERGMSLWRDAIDWLGGCPFEVAKSEDVFRFFAARGFVLENMTTVGGRSGCNQFVFRRP